MRLGGRLAAAIEVLDDIARRDRPAADALRDWGLSHRFAGAGDRAAIGNIVYDALRRKRSAAWLFDADSSRALAFGALMLEWGADAPALNGLIGDDRFAPAPLTADEIATSEQRDLDSAPGAVRADCPDWCVPLAEDAFGNDWVDEIAALALRPPLDLRVNTLAASREQVRDEIAATGAEPGTLVDTCLRIAPIARAGRHPNVQAEPAFQKGWFEVQDQGSQAVAMLAGARPGMQVLDYCAGAGGKTLALAAAMANSGRIVAHDAEKQRLAPIVDRLRRSGVDNVEVVDDVAALDPLQGQMDIVMVDAPCSGSGTWRRRPDTKWRLTDRQLDARQQEQADILRHAAGFVKPGGRLVYITCSIFPAENRHQIEAFAAAHPDFAVVPPAELWRAHFPEAPGAARIDDIGIALSPARTATDGFFAAALVRQS